MSDDQDTGSEQGTLARLRFALAGTVAIAPGVDLMEPACPEWADMIEDGSSPTCGAALFRGPEETKP